MKAYDLSGTLYGAPVDSDGVRTGAINRMGNAYPLKITVTPKEKKQISKEHDKSGQTVASTTSVESILAELVLRQLGARSFAWAVSGLATEMTEASAAVAPIDVVATAPGDYARFDTRKVDTVVITNEAADTTYEMGVDYILNPALAMFTPIESGDITTGETLKVGYNRSAQSGYSIAIGKQPVIQIAVWGSLINNYTGKEIEVELYMVTVTSPDGINLISELDSEYEELNLNLSLNTPPGRTCPGTIDGVPL